MVKNDFLGAVALLFSLLLVVITFTAMAGENYGDVIISRVVRVYDGDTFFADIEAYPDVIGKEMGIRINRIDCPEVRTRSDNEKRLGYMARDLVDSILSNSDQIILHDIIRPKYFRLVGDVTADGVSIADTLISLGLAVPYDGGTKTVDWDTVSLDWDTVSTTVGGSK